MTSDSTVFPARWILIGQFKFQELSPYARMPLNTKNSHLIKIGVSSKRSNGDAEESNVKRFCKEKNCIIHYTDDRTYLVSSKDDDSWKTLLRAAENRKHQEILKISKSLSEGEAPRIYVLPSKMSQYFCNEKVVR